ncbi:antiviral reverse transcriptase Drt3a [Halomonas sp. OfavH-34-E]|uniref:antiviral reverse transcriptase Drt3a n=1 Tax=Halomonas sp. OfavH-34-E TaxID=2954491 RepID=UPI002096CADC|nr:antiviral reverse transcriptase Drt3a [Halomonas sp. OfavH-34-E]MCO7217584.1 RNA-directed DNA polymerase [Halomonas sp. OfavH-34-E]
MDHSFTPESFLKITTKLDPKKHKMGRSKKEYLRFHAKSIEKLKNKDFKINEVMISKTAHGNIKHIDRSASHAIFAVRKANQNIKFTYKVKPANRDKIVRQVIELLGSHEPKAILRLDISKFYESIPVEKIATAILGDYRINYETKNVLHSLYEGKKSSEYSNLHRGLSLSSTMSEIFMESTDKKISTIDGVYYYARFVDDIIVFCTGKPEKVIKDIRRILPKELKLNSKKTALINVKLDENNKLVIHSPSASLEYLGYKFSMSTSKNKVSVDVGIAEEKKKKIKTRLILSAKQLLKNGDKKLFFDRVKFLTGNHRIKGSYGRNKLFSGIHFNYRAMEGKTGSSQSLQELDSFLNTLLFNRKSMLSRNLRSQLNKQDQMALSQYSFKEGFQKKIINNLSEKRISEIKKAWKDVA